VGNLDLGRPWYRGTRMTNADDIAQAAREHFLRWIDWYLVAFPGEADSQEQLAKRLGITAPAISAWRKKGSKRYPNMRNQIRFYLLLNKVYRVHMDTVLFSDPPPLPERR
jgi:hypothetical protein